MSRRRATAAAIAALVAAVMAMAGCAHLVILHDSLSAAEHNDLGVAYERSGDRRLAEREYHKALRKDRGMTRARINLGNLRAAESRWGEAEREYRRALRSDARDADALNNLAYALLRRGRRLGEAEVLATAAVAAAGPRDSVYRATLDEVRAARGRGRAP